MPDTYAIVTIISGKRYYWQKRNQRAKPGAGSWTLFNYATRFTASERRAYTLPKDGQWVSVLHGMGKDSFYPADSELRTGLGK